MKKIQVVKCKCGKVFAASTEPECYTEKEWMDDLREHVKNGCTVDLVEPYQWEFAKCQCKTEEEKSPQGNLFKQEK